MEVLQGDGGSGEDSENRHAEPVEADVGLSITLLRRSNRYVPLDGYAL